MQRRGLLLAGAALALSARAAATPAAMQAAIRVFTGGAPVRTGGVAFEIAPLVENGNTVPITLRADDPAAKTIAVFNGGNPQPQVAVFRFGPRAGQPVVHTRIRLATSQSLTALAQFADGSWGATTVDVVVTLAACVEA